MPTPVTRRLTEARQLMTLAWPIIIAQVAQTGMGFVDTVMAGRYGAQDLAAVAIGSSLWLPLFLAFEGVLMATTPLVAHLVGSERISQTRHVLYQGWLIAAVLGLLSLVLLNQTQPVLSWMQVEPTLAAKTDAYLSAIAWGFPAILIYQVIRSFSEGFGKTRPIMKISILALLANIPLNYLLIYGKLGLPELGGVGCGWASALVMWLTLATGLLYLKGSKAFGENSPFRQITLPDIQSLKHFLRLGLPIGVALLIEVSMFSLIALLLADQGDIVVASHQVTLSFTGLIFMVPLSISMALTIRLGHRLGANDVTGARYSAATGLLITVALSVVSASAIFLLRNWIPTLYSTNPEIIQISAQLLILAAIFQFSDAIQITCAGALRGYKDTLIPLLMVFAAYWLVGMPLGLLLSRTSLIVPAMGAQGFWSALVIALTLGAIMLGARLYWRTRQAQRN